MSSGARALARFTVGSAFVKRLLFLTASLVSVRLEEESAPNGLLMFRPRTRLDHSQCPISQPEIQTGALHEAESCQCLPCVRHYHPALPGPDRRCRGRLVDQFTRWKLEQCRQLEHWNCARPFRQ